MEFLKSEADAGAIDMMRTIKRALDPDGLLNPGKLPAAAGRRLERRRHPQATTRP